MAFFRAMTERQGSSVQAALAALTPVEMAKAELAKRDRVTDAEIPARQDWMRAAHDFAANYTGNFDFMVDMRNAIKRYGGLTLAQMRGTLNVIRAEGQREAAEMVRRAAVQVARPVENTPVQRSAAVVGLNEIQDGFYTVKFEDGSHVTIRINTVKAYGRNRGTRFASYLCGPINTSDYRRFATVKGNQFRGFYGFRKQVAALEILMGATVDGQTAFGKAYARESTRCYRCGKLLTEPESIESGIGPICAGRE